MLLAPLLLIRVFSLYPNKYRAVIPLRLTRECAF